jgi:hypothetical protein
MTYSSPAYIDSQRNEVYYLGADLVLMRAPVRGDVAFAREGVPVRPRERAGPEVEAIAWAVMRTLLDDADLPVRRHSARAGSDRQLPRGRLVAIEVDEEIELGSP